MKYTPTPKRGEIYEAIRVLSRKQFGWDGSHALPMRPDVLDFALQLMCMDGALSRCLEDVEHAAVLMAEDGTVELSFGTDGTRMLLLTIRCGGVITYLQCFERNGAVIEGVVRSDWPLGDDIADYLELTRLIAWLTEE